MFNIERGFFWDPELDYQSIDTDSTQEQPIQFELSNAYKKSIYAAKAYIFSTIFFILLGLSIPLSWILFDIVLTFSALLFFASLGTLIFEYSLPAFSRKLSWKRSLIRKLSIKLNLINENSVGIEPLSKQLVNFIAYHLGLIKVDRNAGLKEQEATVEKLKKLAMTSSRWSGVIYGTLLFVSVPIALVEVFFILGLASPAGWIISIISLLLVMGGFRANYLLAFNGKLALLPKLNDDGNEIDDSKYRFGKFTNLANGGVISVVVFMAALSLLMASPIGGMGLFVIIPIASWMLFPALALGHAYYALGFKVWKSLSSENHLALRPNPDTPFSESAGRFIGHVVTVAVFIGLTALSTKNIGEVLFAVAASLGIKLPAITLFGIAALTSTAWLPIFIGFIISIPLAGFALYVLYSSGIIPAFGFIGKFIGSLPSLINNLRNGTSGNDHPFRHKSYKQRVRIISRNLVMHITVWWNFVCEGAMNSVTAFKVASVGVIFNGIIIPGLIATAGLATGIFLYIAICGCLASAAVCYRHYVNETNASHPNESNTVPKDLNFFTTLARFTINIPARILGHVFAVISFLFIPYSKLQKEYEIIPDGKESKLKSNVPNTEVEKDNSEKLTQSSAKEMTKSNDNKDETSSTFLIMNSGINRTDSPPIEKETPSVISSAHESILMKNDVIDVNPSELLKSQSDITNTSLRATR